MVFNEKIGPYTNSTGPCLVVVTYQKELDCYREIEELVARMLLIY